MQRARAARVSTAYIWKHPRYDTVLIRSRSRTNIRQSPPSFLSQYYGKALHHMPLTVIGAGLPRSGTNSLHLALEHLQYRTQHMKSLVNERHLCDAWHTYIVEQKPVDWKTVFAEYDACCDGPAAFHWEALLKEFPEAKVVLTVRGSDGWVKSYKTLMASAGRLMDILSWLPYIGINRFTKWLLVAAGNKNVFLHKGKLEIPYTMSMLPMPSDPELKVIYEDWVASVKAKCPPDRLLVFDVRDGWAPLCNFLGTPMPDIPFPNSNAGSKGLWTLFYQTIVLSPLRKMLGMKEPDLA